MEVVFGSMVAEGQRDWSKLPNDMVGYIVIVGKLHW